MPQNESVSRRLRQWAETRKVRGPHGDKGTSLLEEAAELIDLQQVTLEAHDEIEAEIVAEIEAVSPDEIEEGDCTCLHCRHSRGVGRLIFEVTVDRDIAAAKGE